jgi:hypothetical protein
MRSLVDVGPLPGMAQVYSRAGRRMLPRMLLGATPSFLASDGLWRLLAVCADGTMRLWDLQSLKVIISGSALPVLGDRLPRPHGKFPGLARIAGTGKDEGGFFMIVLCIFGRASSRLPNTVVSKGWSLQLLRLSG